MTILIIGLGSVGKKHLAAIRKIVPDATVYALRSLPKADNYEGVINIYSLNELTGTPDFVIISNPTSMHRTTFSTVVKLNCPVFMEKPVFGDVEDVETIQEQIKENGMITYVACNLRFHPVIQYLKAFLEKNTQQVNEVNIYCGSWLPDWRPGTDFRKSYSANALMGGGVHLDLIHELDYCTWLFGMPLKLSAEKRNVSSLHIDAIDNARFQFVYPCFTAGITLNYFRKDPKRQVEIITTDDTIVGDLIANHVSSLVSGKILHEGPFSMSDTYFYQMEYFINHINAGNQPMNGMAEGIEVLKLALHE